MDKSFTQGKLYMKSRGEEECKLQGASFFSYTTKGIGYIALSILLALISVSACSAERICDPSAYSAFLYENTSSIMSRSLSVSSNVDAEGPLVDTSSIGISSSIATIGNTVTLRVAIKDEVSGVSFAYAYYTMPQSGDTKQIALLYDPLSDIYEGNYLVTNKSENGKWVLATIQTQDNEGHYSYVRSSLEKGNFTIYGTADADIDGPFVDLSSIETTRKNLTVNESISISVMITDDKTGVDFAYAYYTMPLSRDTKQIQLIYNSSTQKYEGTYFVTNKSENGKWMFATIQTADKAGHYTYIRENLGNGDFTVYGTTGADWQGPVVDLSTLQVNKKSAINGESIRMSVNIIDDISGVHFAYAYYQMPLSKDDKQIRLTLNPVSGKYEGEYTLTSRTEYGLWELKTIQTADNESHYTYVRSYMYPEMSQADFYADPNETHTIAFDPGVPPTYTQTGLTEGQHCSICGVTLVPPKIIPVIPRMMALSLPQMLTKIDDEAFTYNQEIISVEIPENCVLVGSRAFSYCDHLIYVSVKNGDCTIADDAFVGSNNTVIMTIENSKVEKWAVEHNIPVVYYQ